MGAEQNPVLGTKLELEKLVSALDDLVDDMQKECGLQQLEDPNENALLVSIVQKREVLAAVVNVLANLPAAAKENRPYAGRRMQPPRIDSR